MIPYGRQEIDELDKQAVLDVLDSDFLTQGPQVPAFEQELSRRVGAAHSVAMNSATSALHAACLALGVGPSDTVWTSAISFVASANCGIYCGAEIEFVDVVKNTGNMSIPDLRRRLEAAEPLGKLPKVLIPVHFAGQPVNMPAIAELGKKYGFKIIEDASHALGATYGGEPVGSCLYSDITVFSFHPVKMITTGEGGAATTNSPEIYARLQRIRSHGITRDPNAIQIPFEGDWFYDQIEIGFNYRMTDLYAALGRPQLKKLDDFIERRQMVAEQYSSLFENSKNGILDQDPRGMSSWHLFVTLIADPSQRKIIFDKLRQEGILVNVHYRPIYRQSFYARMEKYDPSDFPGAEFYYARAISLPIFPGLPRESVSMIFSHLEGQPGYQNIF
jgi:UDP-4-amino-4,6-dideoxy-N-acetyl-beta-L-altrosamine transaminase